MVRPLVAVDLLVSGPHPSADREEHEEHHQVADAAELLVRHAAFACCARGAAVCRYCDAACVCEVGHAEDDLFGPFLGLLGEYYVAIFCGEMLVILSLIWWF